MFFLLFLISIKFVFIITSIKKWNNVYSSTFWYPCYIFLPCNQFIFLLYMVFLIVFPSYNKIKHYLVYWNWKTFWTKIQILLCYDKQVKQFFNFILQKKYYVRTYSFVKCGFHFCLLSPKLLYSTFSKTFLCY